MSDIKIEPIPYPLFSDPRTFRENHKACANNWRSVKNHFPEFNVLDYGAKGDGVTDDWAALTACATAAGATNGVIVAPPGTYRMSRPWILPSHVSIWGHGYGTLFQAAPGFLGDGYRGVLTVDSGTTDVRLKGFRVDGNRSAQNQALAIADYSNISLLSCSHVYGQEIESINGCGRNTGSGGDGLYIAEISSGGPCVDIHFFDSDFGDSYRNGCSLINAKKVSFGRCHFYGSVGTNPGNGIDLEPNNNTQSLENILFDDCYVYANAGRGVQVYNSVALASITGVMFRGGKIYNNGSNGYSMDGEQFDRAVVLDGVEITNNGDDEVKIAKSYGTSVLDCYIHDSLYNGIVLEHNTGSRTDVLNFELFRNTIRTIGKNGILANYNSGGQNGRISFNRITNVSNGSLGTYFPINIVTSGSVNFDFHIFSNIIRSDSSFTGSGYASYGINIPAGVQSLKVYLNSFDGMTSGAINNLGANNFIQFNWVNGALGDTLAQGSVGLGPMLFNGSVVIGGANGEYLAVNRPNGASNIQLQDGANNPALVMYRNNNPGDEWIVFYTANNTGNKALLKFRKDLSGVETLELDLANQIATFSGDVKIGAVGKGFSVKAGTNGKINLGNILVAGTVTVANTSVTANTVFGWNRVVSGGTLGHITITRNPGVGYTITSSSATETSTIDVMLVEAT